MACEIIDEAIQVHGGGGVSQEFNLAYAYGSNRTLRLADGPDEVHLEAIAKAEFRKNDWLNSYFPWAISHPMFASRGALAPTSMAFSELALPWRPRAYTPWQIDANLKHENARKKLKLGMKKFWYILKL